jgi:hypothetical protein
MSSISLYRGFSGTEMFVDMVKADLEPGERIVSFENLSASKIKKLNVSLFQLLHFAKIAQDGTIETLFSREEIDEIENNVAKCINSFAFSRQIFMSILSDVLGSRLSYNYRDHIESRINILHLGINVGNHLFTEITAERDKNSPFYYGHLRRHLAVLGNCAQRPYCGAGMIKDLRANPSWKGFTHYHLSIMADIYSRRLSDLPLRTPQMWFSSSSKIKEFNEISRIIKHHWA